MRLGIDFGTTRTVVAAADRQNYPVVSFEAPSGDAWEHVPTVAAVRGGEVRYGLDALEASEHEGFTLVRSLKRLLSGPVPPFEATLSIEGRSFRVFDLVVGFLAKLRADLHARSNAPLADGEPLEVVVATPAAAKSAQRLATLEAFRAAGFSVVAMMSEPSAAGVEYAHRFERTLSSRRTHVVVYDLGGGTFDVSVVHMAGRTHDVVASAGLSSLGGDDFDRVLLELGLAASGRDRAALPLAEEHRLLELCRAEKERLHPNSRRIELDLGEGPVTVPVKDYYAAAAPLVERSFEILDRVIGGLSPAEDGLGEVAGIYVAGGASALPIVARTLRERYGRRIHRSVHPSGATAIGLAIAGDPAAGFELTERFGRCFGVFREDAAGRRISFDPILDGTEVLPRALGEREVVRVRSYRARHNLGHYRFVECGWLDADGTPSGDITPIGDLLVPFAAELRAEDVALAGVPVVRSEGEGPRIEEEYKVDPAGAVHVVIRDLDSGFEVRRDLSLVPERRAS